LDWRVGGIAQLDASGEKESRKLQKLSAGEWLRSLIVFLVL
jgi:hypothetical protein